MSDRTQETRKIRTAVVTGRHPFDVPGFHGLFRGIPEIDFYPQHMEDFVADYGRVRLRYDVVLFFNFHQETPGDEQVWWEKGTREALEQLGENTQGVFVLHHALLAYPDWQLWSDICGIQDRRFGYHGDQAIHIDVVDPEHPITRGVSGWDMLDETYTMDEPGQDSHILLTTNHTPSMRALAWTREYRRKRVFCLQSGHDDQAYTNPHFQTVVKQAVQWLAEAR